MKTHIETLTSNTPKARRRVRLICGIKRGVPVGALNAAGAQEVARKREHQAAVRDAAKRHA